MDSHLTGIEPRRSKSAIGGHFWEQIVLPVLVGKGLLWSPANSGPLVVRRQVLTVHDVCSLEHPEWYSPAFRAWYRRITPVLVRRVQRIITVSEFSKQRLIALTGVDEEHISVIPGGVDLGFYPRPHQEIEHVKRSLNINFPRYILSVGTLEPRKNLPRLLRAWELSVPFLPDDVCLVIAGAKGARRVFGEQNLNASVPRVCMTGFVPDENLPALYSGAIALVYISLYEGFGLPVAEGMACGIVPIASNSSAIPELVGNSGLLVNPFDCEEIASSIKTIVCNEGLRQNLSVRASERSKHFSWDLSAVQTLRILQAEARSVDAVGYAQ